MKRVLLAVGDKTLTSLLHKHLEAGPFTLVSQHVYHIKNLVEMTDDVSPDIIVLHEHYLLSDVAERRDREDEWKELIHFYRRHYDDAIRLVFICEREMNDPFLSDLVSLGVLDIFNEERFPVKDFVDQLSDRPRYSRVAHLHTKQSLQPLNVTIEAKAEPMDTENDEEQKGKHTQNHQVADPHSVTAQLREIEALKNEKKKYNQEQEEARLEMEELQKQLSEATKQKKAWLEQQLEEKQAIYEEKKRLEIDRKAIEDEKNRLLEEQKNIQKQEMSRRLRTIQDVVGIHVQSKIVLVGGLFERIGSTFVAHQLASLVEEYDISVTYFESPYQYSYSYDRYFGDKLAPGVLSDYANLLPLEERKEDSQSEWKIGKLRMVTKNPLHEEPYDETVVTFERFIKLLLADKSTFRIIDIGSDWDKPLVKELYEIADVAFVVTDSDIVTAQVFEDQKIEKLANVLDWRNDDKCQFVINRCPDQFQYGAFHHHGEEVYPNALTLPTFNQDVIHMSELKGELLIKQKELTAAVSDAFQPLIELVIPDELVHKQKNSGWLKRFIKK